MRNECGNTAVKKVAAISLPDTVREPVELAIN